jgi:hypothetical protein
MKNNKTLYQSLTVIFSVLIITLGWVYFVYGTTIGTNVTTANLTITGNASTTGIFYANGNINLGSNAADTLTVAATTTFASTTIFTGPVTIGDNGDTLAIDTSDWDISATGDMTNIGSISADGGLTVSAGTTTLSATTTIGTNFYIDADGNASTTGTFVAATTTINNLAIGGGTGISQHVSATTSFDFASLASSTCISTSTALNGISVGDTVIATPEPVASGIETLNMSWNAYASTTNEAALRVCNVDSVSAQDAADQVWRFDAWMH